jgi:NAD(P)-dependent dehydrogenase (short-subunit alcohol dehydrogenase family)
VRKLVLVVGARSNSLGDAVGTALAPDYAVVTAGLNEEMCKYDIGVGPATDKELLENVRPDHIVVTAGVNKPCPPYPNRVGDWYRDHFEVNVTGPMRLLESWILHRVNNNVDSVGHYVAISSNSAHIARTESDAYCASKAALSMALRCRGRGLARKGYPLAVYGYEPGLLRDTPMTTEVDTRLRKEVLAFHPIAMHRMPGVDPGGIDPRLVANVVAANLRSGAAAMLNGTMTRLDAGEQ